MTTPDAGREHDANLEAITDMARRMLLNATTVFAVRCWCGELIESYEAREHARECDEVRRRAAKKLTPEATP